jgi:hypothetical protein
VSSDNLYRTAELIEEARGVPPGHVIYLDYPLNSPHLVVDGIELVGRPDVEIRDVCDGYANMIIVPLGLFRRA